MKHETTYLRGARSFVQGRFETLAREPFDDGWTPEEKDAAELQTSVTEERARSIISRNDSPDIGFSQSINPYRAASMVASTATRAPAMRTWSSRRGSTSRPSCSRRPTRPSCCAPSCRSRLRAEPDRHRRQHRLLPADREKFRITRQIVEILAECEHPFTLVTKSALVERDLDLLAPMAKKNLVKVFVSIGSLDRALARKLEPRAASPQRRMDVLRNLAQAGVPCGVMVAALIPGLNDKTLEEVLEAASAAGAAEAAYVVMRLPNELKELFKEWLAAHYPERAGHVISIVRQMRGGRDNDPRFGSRMTGTGLFAELIEKRFEIACRRFGLNGHGAGRKPPSLDCSRFRPPSAAGQMPLF